MAESNSTPQNLIDALTTFFYVASRDYDISGKDFADVVREHVAKAVGKTPVFSDDQRRQWSAELAAEFAHMVPVNNAESERRAFKAGFASGDGARQIDNYGAWAVLGRPTYEYECWMRQVASSNIQAIGWYADGLVIRFTNGSVYEYQNVTRELFDRFLAAESKGQFFHAHIKSDPERFPVRKLEPTS